MKPNEKISIVDQARAMYVAGDYLELRAFKKAKKKSWSVLGFNRATEDRILRVSNHKDYITETQSKVRARQRGRALFAEFPFIDYVPRMIHAIKGTTSHSVIGLMAQIKEQEKFRADPRFPIYQMVERGKRYAAIFKGIPYKPIFS